jgi:hypothetical protein
MISKEIQLIRRKRRPLNEHDSIILAVCHEIENLMKSKPNVSPEAACRKFIEILAGKSLSKVQAPKMITKRMKKAPLLRERSDRRTAPK